MAARFTPAQGAVRVLRGGALAITSASLSVAAHAAAGGSLPGPVRTTVITALLAGVGTALADRRRGSLTIVGAVGLIQLALHSFLQLSSPHQGRSHQSHHGGMPFDLVSMTIGHAAVALATGLVLAHADHALFVVAQVLARVLPTRGEPLPVVITTGVSRIRDAGHPVRQRALLRINAPRGPPENS